MEKKQTKPNKQPTNQTINQQKNKNLKTHTNKQTKKQKNTYSKGYVQCNIFWEMGQFPSMLLLLCMILPELRWVRFSRPFSDGLNFHMHEGCHLLWPLLIAGLLETLEVSVTNILNCTELEHFYISCLSILQM